MDVTAGVGQLVEGTMTCISHQGQIKPNVGHLGNVAPDLDELLGAATALRADLGSFRNEIVSALNSLQVIVHSAPAIVNIEPVVIPAPIVNVTTEKPDAPVVNVSLPKQPDICPQFTLNPAVDVSQISSIPVVLNHTSQEVQRYGATFWIVWSIPTLMLICDMVARLLHL